MHGAQARAIAEVGDDDSSVGKLGRDLAKLAADELIGQPVEAVAADARIGKLARKCEGLGKVRLGLVEGRVEAGHLRDVRRLGRDRLDRRQIVRLVQRRERRQRFQRLSTPSSPGRAR